MIKTVLSVLSLAAFTAYAAPAQAQATLAQVKARGSLNCQVGTPTAGFYALGSDGTWSGMDVDMCRAVAAAIFNDPKKVQFQSVTSAVRFTSLANGESDMLSRTTTWTAVRDTQLGLEFAGVNFYDGQGLMVAKAANIKSAKELNNATVCVLTGTTSELNVADFYRSNNMTFKAVTAENESVLITTYLGGGCDVYTNDKSGLAAIRSAFPKPDEHIILPETISKEPLGPVVRHGDQNWGDIVRWTLNGLIEAEEGWRHFRQRRRDAEVDEPRHQAAARRRGQYRRGHGPDQGLHGPRAEGGRQLRRDLRAERRRQDAGQHPARRLAECALDQGRHPLRAAVPLMARG